MQSLSLSWAMSHSREINDSATKSATNLQTPQSVHQSKGHGKRFLRLPRGGTLSKTTYQHL
jgi:hypothetical protein